MPSSFSPTALRDALGFARLLYAAETATERADRAAAVASAGKLLADALRLARMELGSLGHRAAPANAEKGMAALRAVGWSAEVERLIDVAAERVRNAGG